MAGWVWGWDGLEGGTEEKHRLDNFLFSPIERLFRKYCYFFTLMQHMLSVQNQTTEWLFAP